jgi:hypothetical protein
MSEVKPRATRARVRNGALAVSLFGALSAFAWFVHGHYPISEWLFWRYAAYWAYSALFAVASFSSGLAILHWAQIRLPLLERLAIAFAIGVFAFQLAMFLVGVFQAYSFAAFLAVPAALAAWGAPVLVPLAVRTFRVGSAVERRVEFRRSPRRRLWTLLAAGFGCAGLAMLYFTILTPDNVQFDARWKQMALA